MDFGPKWNYEYRIKPLETDNHPRTVTSMNRLRLASAHSLPKLIDIIIKSNKSNPRLIQVAEAHIFDRKDNANREKDERNDNIQKMVKISMDDETGMSIKEDRAQQFVPITPSTPLVLSDEHTEAPNEPKSSIEDTPTKTGKHVQHLVRIAGDLDDPKPAKLENFKESLENDSDELNHRATLMTGHKRKHKHLRKNGSKTTPQEVKKDLRGNDTIPNATTKVAKVYTPPVTAADNAYTVQDIFVKSRLVKEDPKITEFTRHLYEQSIKTLEAIKVKIDNYQFKKEADKVMRTYEDTFGEFVRETQNLKIKTRAGSQKVILNTLDTSNTIMDRLANYLIGTMDRKGLRLGGTENIILNEIKKNQKLEKKHICTKMKICPTADSYSKFVIDILRTVLDTPDNKITEIRDACTEVLKNTDFSNALDPDTEKRFLRGINDVEKFDVGTTRPLFYILMNLLTAKNSPIQVVGRADGRVNRTVAFLDIVENIERNLPPNEQNVLEWNDMRYSFKEWMIGKRHDTADLIQHFVDHANKAIGKEDSRLFDRNVNTILGF